jgi:hypothetical protein
MPAVWDDPISQWDDPVATWDAQVAVWVGPPDGRARIVALPWWYLRAARGPRAITAPSASVARTWSPCLITGPAPGMAASPAPRMLVGRSGLQVRPSPAVLSAYNRDTS